MYFYRDYFILHPNQVICRVWSLRLFYRLSLWLAYMLYAKIVIIKKYIYKLYTTAETEVKQGDLLDLITALLKT